MGLPEKPKFSRLEAFVLVTFGFVAILIFYFLAAAYFIFADDADSRVECPNKECGSTTGSTNLPATATACRVPSSTVFEKSVECLENSCWHFGPPDKFNAQCVNGHCECNATHYSQLCLPCVGACHIQELDVDSSKLHATPRSSQTSYLNVYSCIGEEGKFGDVHVLGVYENIHKRPPTAGTINVNITTSSSRPVILVLTNYQPVKWVLHFTPPINIEKIILIAYYSDLSSVTAANGISQSFIVEKRQGTPRGFGSDSGGGSTAEMLVDLHEEFGAVTSFAGTYRADSWNWNLPTAGENSQNVEDTAEAFTMSNDETVEVTEDSWAKYTFRFDDSWNSCHGDQYVRRRPIGNFGVGRYIGVILCTRNRYKIVMADDLHDEFKNVADGNGAGEDHCEFVGATNEGTVDSNFWESPSTIGYYRADWGDDITRGTIGGGTGASWTGLYYPTWYECGVSIP